MCQSIHYFTIVFNISLQYVQLVSNVSLSCILYMLLPFDVGIIYLLDVNKCTHLVSGGIHTTFLEILLWSATEQVTGNVRYKNILLLLLYFCTWLSLTSVHKKIIQCAGHIQHVHSIMCAVSSMVSLHSHVVYP